MGEWYSNVTFSTTNATWSGSNITFPSVQVVTPPQPPTLREKTALEKLDDRINEVRALVAA